MAYRAYLIVPVQGCDDSCWERIADAITARRGVILMKTSLGSLVALFDEAVVDGVRSHPLIELVGPVHVDPSGKAAKALQAFFAQRLVQQLRPGSQ